MKRYLRQYCNNGEIVTAAAKSLRAAAAIFIQTQPSLTDLLAQSFAQKGTQKQLVIISSAIYIYKTIKIITFQTFFLCFFTIFERYPDEFRVAFFNIENYCNVGPNDSNVLSESHPKYRSKKLRLIYLLTYKNATHIYIQVTESSRVMRSY